MSIVTLDRSRSLGMVIAVTSLGFLVVQLDVSVVNVALVRIGQSLHGGMAGLQWVVDAYTLAFAAFLLSGGALGDRLGARRVFMLGLALFGAASLACALAPSLAGLVAARAVQGVGAACLMPASLAVLNHACGDDAPARARALGLWTAAGGVALSAGPLVGGMLVDHFGWPSIFLVNLPICAAGIVLAWRHTAETGRHRGGGMDPVGQLCAIVMLLGMTGAMIEAGAQGWQAPMVRAGLFAAVLAFGAFVLVEARGRAPMLPLSFFRNRTFNAAMGVGLAANFVVYGVIFVLSLYFQNVRDYSPAVTGLAFLPFMATVILANVAGSRLAARTGPRLPMVLGLLIGATGFALLLRIDADVGYAALMGRLLLVPVGVGMAVPAMTAALLGSVPRTRSGLAAGALNTVRQAAGAIGVALYGALAAGNMLAGMRTAFLLSAVGMVLAGLLAAWGVRRSS